MEKTQTYAEKKIRLPLDVMEGMARAAKEEDRSVNGEILRACRAWLKERAERMRQGQHEE